MEGNFSVELLSNAIKQEMIDKKIWKESCPISLDRLRLVKFPYYDFENILRIEGQMVVLEAIAAQVIKIFKALYKLKFPIAKAIRMEAYDGDDQKSMEDNNTSCFNCREITGGSLPSIHSYGLAIDINPIQNPYIGFENEQAHQQGKAYILPNKGKEYLNRTNIRPGMAESVINIFKKNGLSIWGGSWNFPIDWQHFQPSRAVAQLLAVMSSQHAINFFEKYANNPQMFNTVDAAENPLLSYYQQDATKFMCILTAYQEILALPAEKGIKQFEDAWKNRL